MTHNLINRKIFGKAGSFSKLEMVSSVTVRIHDLPLVDEGHCQAHEIATVPTRLVFQCERGKSHKAPPTDGELQAVYGC